MDPNSDGYPSSGEPMHAVEAGLMETPRHLIEILRQRYKFIKQNLDPSDKVIDELYQQKLIGRACREGVLPLARSDRARAIDKVIKDLVRKLTKLDDKHYKISEAEVQKIFNKYGYMYMLEAETMPRNTVEDLNINLTETKMNRLFNNPKIIKLLKDELEPLWLIDNLLIAGTLTFVDHEDIRQTAPRPARVEGLLMYIRGDIPKKGPAFLGAIQANSPRLLKKLLNDLHTSGHEVVQPDVQVRITAQGDGHVANLKVLLDREKDITVRLKFNGKHGEITVVEKDIVSHPHPELDTEAMDCDTTLTDFCFSSVVIRLRPLSARAAAMLTDMLWNQSDGFKQWLTKLLNGDQLDKLKKAGWSSVSIEVSLVSPAGKLDSLCGCLITKQLLGRDCVKALFCEQMQDVDRVARSIYDMCRLTYFQRKEMARFMNLSDSGQKREVLIDFLSSLSEEFLCVFEIALRETGQVSLLERCVKLAKVTDDCSKRSSTENCHRHLKRCNSLCLRDIIEELIDRVTEVGIKQPDMFLDELVKSETLNDIKCKKIDEIQAMSGDKTEEVLKLLKDLPQSCTCRLEFFLKQTGQNNILEYFKQCNELLVTGEITKDEVKENRTFLVNELEPKIFKHVLPDTEQTSIPLEGCRPDRCRVFLDKMLESDQCDANVRKFVTALGQLKLYHVLRILYLSKKSKNMERARVFGDILKHKILENKRFIMDEIDITMLKATFIDRRVFTEEQFEVLTNRDSRRECVVALLKGLFQKGYAAMVCFVAALKLSGYMFVAGTIENTTDPVLPCSCLDEATGSQTLLDASFSVELTVKDDHGTDKTKIVKDIPKPEKAEDKQNPHDTHEEKHHNHSDHENFCYPELNRSVGKSPPVPPQDNLTLPGGSTQYNKKFVNYCCSKRVEGNERSQSESRCHLNSVRDLEKRGENAKVKSRIRSISETRWYLNNVREEKRSETAKNGSRQQRGAERLNSRRDQRKGRNNEAMMLLYDCKCSQRNQTQYCYRYRLIYPSACCTKSFCRL